MATQRRVTMPPRREPLTPAPLPRRERGTIAGAAAYTAPAAVGFKRSLTGTPARAIAAFVSAMENLR